MAGIAAYVSYWHAYAVVRAHGETGITARLEPATIDGLVYASSMVVLYAAWHRVPVPSLARWLLALGIAATLTATWPRAGPRSGRGGGRGLAVLGVLRAVSESVPLTAGQRLHRCPVCESSGIATGGPRRGVGSHGLGQRDRPGHQR